MSWYKQKIISYFHITQHKALYMDISDQINLAVTYPAANHISMTSGVSSMSFLLWLKLTEYLYLLSGLITSSYHVIDVQLPYLDKYVMGVRKVAVRVCCFECVWSFVTRSREMRVHIFLCFTMFLKELKRTLHISATRYQIVEGFNVHSKWKR